MGIFYVKRPVIGHQYVIKTNRNISERSCTSMVFAALSTIGSAWNKLTCPPADEWIMKMWYTYPVKFYSTIKKN